jgi:hypothetical protein
MVILPARVKVQVILEKSLGEIKKVSEKTGKFLHF